MQRMRYEELPALGDIRDFSKLDERVRVIIDVAPSEFVQIIKHVKEVAVNRGLVFCTATKGHVELWLTKTELL